MSRAVQFGIVGNIRRMVFVELERGRSGKELYDCFVIAVIKIEKLVIGVLVCHAVEQKEFVEFCQITNKISDFLPQNIDIRIKCQNIPDIFVTYQSSYLNFRH